MTYLTINSTTISDTLGKEMSIVSNEETKVIPLVNNGNIIII